MRYARRLVIMVLLVAVAACARPAAQVDWPLPAEPDTLLARARADSTDPEALVLMGYVHWNRGRWDSAAAAYRRALDFNARYAPAHLALALLPFRRYSTLERDLERDRVTEPFRDTVRVAFEHYRLAALFDPLAEFGPPDMPRDSLPPFPVAPSSDFAAFLGIQAYQGRNYRRAVRLLDGFVRSRSNASGVPGPVLWYLALAHAQEGRFQPGADALRILVTRSTAEESKDSSHTPVPFLVTNDLRYALAYFQARSGALSDAIRTYEQVLTHDLGYWMAHVRIAELEERFRRFDRALTERARALALRPDDRLLQREYAVTLGRSGRLRDADSLLARLAAESPWDPWTPYYRGEVAWLLGDRDASRVAFERFLLIAPRSLDSLKADVRLRLLALQ